MGVTHKSIVFPHVPHGGEMGLKFHDTAGNVILEDITPQRWVELWEMYCEEWADTAIHYEEKPGDFYYAWHYLDNHPAFWEFRHGPTHIEPLPLAERLHVKNMCVEGGINRCVMIMPVKVNADTRSTEDGPPLETEVWIELGKKSWPVEHDPKEPGTYDNTHHDYLLDCGGPTIETAILRAAHNVWEVYGNDRRICDALYNKCDYITVLEGESFEELLATLDDPGEVNERVRQAAQRLNGIVNRPGSTN